MSTQVRISPYQRIAQGILRRVRRVTEPPISAVPSIPAPPPTPNFYAMPVDVTEATLTQEERSLIRELVLESGAFPGPIIEVGTLLGATTMWMALAKKPEQRIMTVDNYCWNPWYLTPKMHEALTAHCLYSLRETGHVEQVVMGKNEFFASYDGPPPSMVFLDAWHTYEETKRDIDWAMSLKTPIIAGHDYCDLWPGVIQAVEESGGAARLRGSVWVLPT